MAQKNQIDILINTLYDRTGIKASKKHLDRLKYSIDKSGKVVDSFTGKVADTTKVMQSMGKNAMPRFQMGWLSVMFAAMKVKKIMTSMWKDMLSTFKKVGGKMHPLNLAMTRLNAGFTFLKFSIINAMRPMLERFVIWLSGLAISIAEMDPGTLKTIGIALGVITGVAFVAGFVAEFALLAGGIIMLANAGVIPKLAGITKGLKGLTGLAAAGLTFDFMLRGVRLLSEDGSTIVDNLLSIGEAALAGALWGGLVGGPVGAVIGGLLGVSIGVVVSLADVAVESGFWDQYKAWVSTVFKESAATFSQFGNTLKEYTGIGAMDAGDVLGGIDDSTMQATADASKQFSESVIKLAELSTPQSLQAIQELWDQGTIQNLAMAVTGEGGLVPAFQQVTVQLDGIQVKMDTLQTDWESWDPPEKTLVVNVVRKGDTGLAGSVGTGATTPYGTT